MAVIQLLAAPDSDGDGVSDADEIIAGTDPLLDEICSHPKGFFIFPGEPESILDFSSATDPLIGIAFASTSNRGMMFPVQSGQALAASVPASLDYRLTGSGGLDSARWIWRPDAGVWRGRNGTGQIWAQHQPDTSINADSEPFCVAYSETSQYHYIFYYSTADKSIHVLRRSSADAFDGWTDITQKRLTRPPAGLDSLRAVALPDGEILIFVWVTIGTLGELDVYRAVDDGADVFEQHNKALGIFGLNNGSEPADVHFDAAISGDIIRMSYCKKPEGTGDQTTTTIVSTDWGGSFQALQGLNVEGLVSDEDFKEATGALALIPTTPRDGGFLLVHRDSDVRMQTRAASGVNGWGAAKAIIGGAAHSVTGLSGYSEGGYAYVVSCTRNAAANAQTGIVTYRKSLAEISDTTVEWDTVSTIQHPAPKYMLTALQSTRSGSVATHMYRKILFTAQTHPGGTLDTGAMMHTTGGWSAAPLGPDTRFQAGTDQSVSIEYLSFFGDVDGTVWVKTATGTIVSTRDHLEFTTAIGQTAYVTSFTTGTDLVMSDSAGDRGSCAGMIFRMPTPTGDPNLGISLVGDVTLTGGPLSIDLLARAVSTTSIELYDNVAAAVIATITPAAMSNANFTDVRIGLSYDAVTNVITARLSAAREDDLTAWVSDSGVVATQAAISTVTIKAGQLVASAATTRIRVHRIWLSETEAGAQMNQDEAPGGATIRGTVATSGRLETVGGLFVSFGGVGGVKQDSWATTIGHRYGPQHVLDASPQFAWRTVNDTSAGIIAFESDSTSLFTHSAAYLSGLTAPKINIEYSDSSTFAPLIAVATLDSTIVSAVGYVVDRDTIALGSALGDIAVGELNGMMVTDGTNVAIIKNHSEVSSIQLVDADGSAVSAAAWGATVSIYSPVIVAKYIVPAKARYYRFNIPIQPTPGNFFRVASRVMGMHYTPSLPFEWAQTKTTSANMTTSRAKSGAEWRREEGPTGQAWRGRLVGDTVRIREEITDLAVAQASISVRPICLVINSVQASAKRNHLYGYLDALTQDQAAFGGTGATAPARVDAMGDMGLSFTEAV